ncbi:hypothetical protein M422DRAFT_178404, partial [Sphaerobolus stellatus SS14]
YKPGSMNIVQRFQLMVENAVFMGQQNNPMGTTLPNMLDTPIKIPRSGKGLISYTRKAPSTPMTPTHSQGLPTKHHQVEASESSSDCLGVASQESIPQQPDFQ